MLKSLELVGFKSFADKTTFEFSAGITCIVGPNGSGKSNVVDAMKWILGDQSPKSLRGKEMTDVIFNGSGGRKPAGYAEATLVFDNTSGFLALDATEVQVGRRVYRSGEAEYLLNRAPARLKDIKDLFLGTGAGSSAYSIIEQGRVAALLETTTANRRAVFEEAAGISRFKARKVDALKKLERVGQNLQRLTDIVEEVGGQLTTLRSQAVKATRFRECADELRELRIGLAADDWRAREAELAELEHGHDSEAAELAALEATHQAMEREQAALDAQVADVEDRLRQVERAAAQSRETIAGHETAIVHQAARRTELAAEIERLQRQQEELEARAAEAVGELHTAAGALEKYATDLQERQQDFERRQETLRSLTEEIERLRELVDQDREKQLALLQQTSVLSNRTAGLESQSTGQLAAQERATARRRQAERELTAARQEAVARHAAANAAAEQAAVARQTAEEQRANRDNLRGRCDEQQHLLSQLREQRSAGLARRNLLEDLEQRQEGVGIGVKEILSRARDNPVPPWDTVLGSVADLLSVDLEHAALLEIALGGRAQVLVVSSYGPLVEYLTQGRCQISGRVGFLALDGTTAPHGWPASLAIPATAANLSLDHCPGMVGRADRLIKTNPALSRLAERLLGDTWIVRTLDVAFGLSSTEGRGARFVTLQGELLESDGTLYVGAVRSETALVSRKSELRVLKNDLLRLDRAISQGEQSVARLQQELQEVDADLVTAQAEGDRHAQRVAELASLAAMQDQEIERISRGHEEAADEAAHLEAARRKLEAETDAARSELTQTETALHLLKQDLAASEEQLAELESSRTELQQELSREQLDLAKQEERLHNLQNARTRLDQELAERDLQRDEAERRVRLLATKQAQIEQHLAQSQAAVAELTEKNQGHAVQVAALQEERDAVRRQRSELAERELQTRHQRRERKERQHSVELRRRELRQQREHLAERIREEFQIEVAAAAQQGATALAASSTENADGVPAAPPTRDEIEDRIDKLRRRLKSMGNVNTDSLQDLDELEGRYTRLSTQLQDLVEAKSALEDIVRRINLESKRLFTETFAEIRLNFQELFRKMFGGGDGDIVLEDAQDVLDCGIDIVARPPGKELRSISLMSGGEKTLTAFALLMAIFKTRPSPFCVLDEVDAPLDDGNKERYVHGLQEFRRWTQFIVITHAKHTMTAGDLLHGVTMEEAGVSKRISIRFDDVGEDGQFRKAA